MSSEVDDDFELNYIKIDSKNEIELLETDDYAIEVDRLFSTVMNFENFNISKKLIKMLKNIFMIILIYLKIMLILQKNI